MSRAVLCRESSGNGGKDRRDRGEAMRVVGRIALPSHPPEGGFDHAAVDSAGDRLYIAHPSNDALEVVELQTRSHVRSIGGLRGVAGVWVDPVTRLLFTSNRGEDTASIFRLEERRESELFRVPTGVRPNGLAFDPERNTLLVAGVGNPKVPDAPPTLTFVDSRDGRRLDQFVAPGRTRWALYHRESDAFYVNIADPPSVVVVRGDEVSVIARAISVAAKGPHGLEQDPSGRLLYCACDEGLLLSLEPDTSSSRVVARLAGSPDVLWLDRKRSRLYCAVGEPGSIDVFDLNPARPSARVPTAEGAHTLTVDERRNEVHVFLPGSHEDLVLGD